MVGATWWFMQQQGNANAVYLACTIGGGNLGFLGFSILAIMGKPPETAALSHWA